MDEHKTPAQRGELARDYFYKGYNCTQAVALAFADVTGLNEEQLMKVACSFGGGMGRLREVCGAFSGMLIVLGLAEGYSGPEKGQVKADHYKKVQQLAAEFERRNGGLVCRKLLGLGDGRKKDDPVPEQRTPEYYKKRPCPEIIANAAEILAEFFESEKPTQNNVNL